MLSREDQEPLTQILEFLFSLLPEATKYTELTQHGSSKLVAYFQVKAISRKKL